MVVKIAVGIVIGILAIFFIFFVAGFILVLAGSLAAMLYIIDIFFGFLYLVSRRKKWA